MTGHLEQITLDPEAMGLLRNISEKLDALCTQSRCATLGDQNFYKPEQIARQLNRHKNEISELAAKGLLWKLDTGERSPRYRLKEEAVR